MATKAALKLVCFGLLACMLISSPTVDAAITCNQVTSYLAPCFGYLVNGGPVPPACCNGVRGLNGAARSSPDRKIACGCIKSTSARISGIKAANAASLPSKCGVNIPYKISPSTDCSRVS